jgi:hypothetical protein
MWRVKICDCPQDTGDKGAEYGMNAYGSGD